MNPAAVLSIVVRSSGTKLVASQLISLDTTAKKASGSLDAAAASQGRLAQASTRARSALSASARTAGFVAVGVGAIGAAAVKSAATYEQSMNTLKAVSGATGAEMNKLSKLAVKLGADTRLPGTSAQDAATAMTEMIKAGVSLKDTMAGVRSTLLLSAAAGISNADAAEIASNALNAFKLKGKDVAKVTDELANTANASSVEISDVSDSFKMAAAVFAGFQKPVVGAMGAITELNVAVGLLGNAGIKGSDAGTSLKQMLLQLTGPSNKAKEAMAALYAAARDNTVSQAALTKVVQGGGTARKEALAQIYKMNPALKDGGDIAYTAAGKMRSLKDIIALVTAGTKNMTQEQKNAYLTQIFGADATRSVIALMQAGPAAFDKMTKSVERQGAAQDLADAKMKGLKGSIEALRSSVETLGIDIGSKLLPSLTAVVKGVTAVTGALTPTAWTALIGVIGGTAAAVWLLNAALNANPAIRIATAIGILSAALITLYQTSDKTRVLMDRVADVFLGVFATIIDGEGAVARLTGKLIPGHDAFDKFADAAQRASDKINGIREGIREADSPFHDLQKTTDELGFSLETNFKKGKMGADSLGTAVTTVNTKFADLQKVADTALGNISALTKPLSGKIGRVGDGIGAGMAAVPSSAGSKSLMGAQSALGPFASIGAKLGYECPPVGVQGRSPRAATCPTTRRAKRSTMAGSPPAGMMAYFKYMKSHYGSRLAELIYTARWRRDQGRQAVQVHRKGCG
jgi:TP901 family phage tail tape measure protein